MILANDFGKTKDGFLGVLQSPIDIGKADKLFNDKIPSSWCFVVYQGVVGFSEPKLSIIYSDAEGGRSFSNEHGAKNDTPEQTYQDMLNDKDYQKVVMVKDSSQLVIDINADKFSSTELLSKEPLLKEGYAFIGGDNAQESTIKGMYKVAFQKIEDAKKSEPVTLTGKELGNFPDTPEGKKELRAAAKAEFEKLLGEWVDCPALNSLGGENTKVEIRKRGVKEFLAFSGNPKKLKLVAEIANIIKTAKITPNSWQPNIKADKKRSADGYYHLANKIKIEGDALNVTVIIEKDNNGLLHYDVLVPSNIIIDSDSKKMSKQPVPDNYSGGDLDTEASKPTFDSILDSGEWVVNLFIEGEPLEVVNEEVAPIDEEPTAQTIPTQDDLAPPVISKTVESEQPETDFIGDVDDGLSDHYLDDNYRFKDVGYIAGARKEKAQLAIMQAKKSGQLVSVTDIDWEALEDDSRIAAATIIKKNVFGQVDWDALKDGGMNGNVAYFIKRLYAAVELQPDDDSPEGRKLYVTAIQNLRPLFESCLTMDDAVREIVAFSKLLNTHRNMIKDEDGKATLNYDSQIANALGKKFKSWVFKTGNKAIHESRVMADDDWSWLEKSDKATVSKPKKQGFQLEAAGHIQRVGGTEVSIQSTEQFKESFGLKAIQSGNWVLKDKESIEFHIQRAAESMLDMADVTGIAPELLGFGGRLGLAFGARGKGGALAHYEPVARVINITKMKGGGSLGHEYFHALDNLIQDLVTQQNNGKAGFFATETPHLLPESLTKNAFVTLRTVLLDGDESLTETLKLTDKDFRVSAYNMKPEFVEKSEVKRNIAAAGSVWDAVLAVDAHFARSGIRRLIRSSSHMDFVRIAAAHYADKNAEFVNIPSLEKGSQFLQDALLLDDFKRGKYWSKPLEMAARAYSSYLQDKLEQQGRTNDYLAYSTKGGHGRVGEEAYPQGKERERIHAAFDVLFGAIKEEQVFEKAIGNKDLMDSVFWGDMDSEELLTLGYEREIITG